MLTIKNECKWERLASNATKKLTYGDVLGRLSDLVPLGVSRYLHRDNRPEFTANRVRDCLECVKLQILFMESGSLGRIFHTGLLYGGQGAVKQYRCRYDTTCQHGLREHRPPAL